MGETTFNGLLQQRTTEYLNYVKKQTVNDGKTVNPAEKMIEDPNDPDQMIPNPDWIDLEAELLNNTNTLINEWNEECDKVDRIKRYKCLAPVQIAQILITLFGASRIAASGSGANRDYDLIAIYNQYESDFNFGTYTSSMDDINHLCRQFNYMISERDQKEVMQSIRDLAPRRFLTEDRDLIPVNNGVFHYRRKELLEYDPGVVFLSKSHVNYVDNPKNPVLHNKSDNTDWDVETWMSELSDDPEIVQLLWEICGAILRPNVSWNKSAWLYSEKGNNGKGTLCELMRNLLGIGAYASIPLKDFGSDFMLEQLVSANAIIVDENDVGTYIDQAAKLKAVITNDVISINRKYKTPIVYRFHGFMVQCMNEFPKVKDRSDSFYRRQLFIPMEKRFQGIERKYIKDDYLKRQEVLEYVLHKVLFETDYYELSEPQICKDLLEEYKEFNDPVRQFFTEVEEEATWDLLPWTFLYDLYRHWFVRNVPSGKQIGRNVFMSQMRQLAEESVVFKEGANLVRSAGRMDGAELLIAKYDVDEWMNKYNGGDPIKASTLTNLKESYRGLERVNRMAALPDIVNGTPVEKDDDDDSAGDGND